MQFRFAEGQSVQIKDSRPSLGLKAGDTGVVWALYALEFPAYEVTFSGQDGAPFDVLLFEEELQGASSEAGLRVSQSSQAEAA